MPEDWEIAIMVPINKKGDNKNPANYRSKALMSHTRKVIEAAIATSIRKHYEFNLTQLGFQEHTGTETAILRHNAAAKEMGYTAILDLKAANDRVPRHKLL